MRAFFTVMFLFHFYHYFFFDDEGQPRELHASDTAERYLLFVLGVDAYGAEGVEWAVVPALPGPCKS